MLAKVKLFKGKRVGGGGGFSAKRHFTNISKIDTAKRSLKSRHSFTSISSAKKSMAVTGDDQKRASITNNKILKKTLTHDVYLNEKKHMNGCSTP